MLELNKVPFSSLIRSGRPCRQPRAGSSDLAPEAGQYVCVRILTVSHSVRLAGRAIRFGSPNIMGYLIMLLTRSKYDHAFLYIGDGKIIEAQPEGVRLGDLSEYAGLKMVCSHDEMTDEQRWRIIDQARGLIGTPYGYLDLLCLGLVCLGLPYHRILRRVMREDREICSQVVAACGAYGGMQSWLCGRPVAQLVTPGLLSKRPGLVSLTEIGGGGSDGIAPAV